MRAIALREFKAYFTSPTGYIFLGFALFISGLMFVSINLTNQITDMTSYFSNISIVFLFMVPLLTMRLISEDKRNKTDQLLITSPINVLSIVLGKYLAALMLFGIYMIITCIYPVVLAMYGAPVLGTIITLYIGYFLLGASLISIGILVTSLTESQVTAAIATFALLLIVWFADWVSNAVGNKYVTIVIEWLSLLNRFQEYVSGIFNVSTVIYYISFIALFIFLTVQQIEKKRWS